MQFKNKIILIISAVVLILIGYFYLFSSKESLFTGRNSQVSQAPDAEEQNSANTNQSKTQKQTSTNVLSETMRQNFIKSIVMQINEISPEKLVSGQTWRVNRVWFATDTDAYVEYEHEHTMRKVLLSASGAFNMPQFEVIAFFEPGEDDWQLIKGKDTVFGKALDLYEFDNELKKWRKMN